MHSLLFLALHIFLTESAPTFQSFCSFPEFLMLPPQRFSSVLYLLLQYLVVSLYLEGYTLGLIW